jgi:dGTPase
VERTIPNPSSLSNLAMREELSRGRRFHEPRHRYRTEYSRDRDRIIHSRAFRRLEAKTQVFTTRYSDHFRNRLTHTLEVTQIARTVSTALGLNCELAEALALVHDIGHPPFGHAGERKLNELMQAHGASFDHNLHALRIVERFEHRYLEFTGLNLTFEVREGIIKHSRDYQPGASHDLDEYLLDLRPPISMTRARPNFSISMFSAPTYRYSRKPMLLWIVLILLRKKNSNSAKLSRTFLTRSHPI